MSGDSELKRIVLSADDFDVPAGLRHGERVAIALGSGPRVGSIIGYAIIEATEPELRCTVYPEDQTTDEE
jgi:hypothetical protein